MLTDEQLEQRQHGIGASEIAAIAGLNPWKKPIDVWLEKTGRAQTAPQDLRQDLGHRMEGVIADLYAERTGATLLPCPTLVHPEEPWILATPDRIASFGDPARDRLLEIKLVGARLIAHWADDTIPDYVVTQVLMQQHVTGIHEAEVAALLGGSDLRILSCPHMPEVIADLVEIGREFWFEHVMKDVPPPVDGSDSWARYIRARWPKDLLPVMKAPPEATAIARRLARAKEDLAAAEVRKAEAENAMKTLLADAAGFVGDGWRCTYKSTASNGVDWKAVALELGATPELQSKHTRPGSRRFAFQAEGDLE